jgi:hypothetical protein
MIAACLLSLLGCESAATPVALTPHTRAARRAQHDAGAPAANDAGNPTAQPDASLADAGALPAGPRGDASASADAQSSAAADAALLAPAAPGRASYLVPVRNAELLPFSSFDVGKVHWSLQGTDVDIEYDFPKALSGIGNQQIAFHGSVVEPGVADVAGSTGSARCTFTAELVRCDEMMTRLTTDPASAEQMLQAAGISEQERVLRSQVIEAFSSDPIGVLTFPDRESGHAGE